MSVDQLGAETASLDKTEDALPDDDLENVAVVLTVAWA